MSECAFYVSKGRNGWHCRILNENFCAGEACSSYKTVEQISEQNARCKERLRSLPITTQEYIKQKYKINF